MVQSGSIEKPLCRLRLVLTLGGAGLLLSGLQTSWAQPWPVPEKPRRTIAVPVPIAPAQPLEQPEQWETMLLKATVNGKYRTLLRQFTTPEDANVEGEFQDLGFTNRTEWAGLKELPSGYWVYVAPIWFVWRDLAPNLQPAKPRRSWGPEQVAGAPDTTQMGDITTAWASRTPDAQPEWLLLEYAELVQPAAIKIYESYNPGAVSKITVFALDGQEVEVWAGQDPTSAFKNAVEPAEFGVQFKAAFKTNRIKIYLDSPQVTGWNEIDAVGLVDAGEKTHWARSVVASSTYADPDKELGALDGGLALPEQVPEDRIGNLEKEVQDLKTVVAELKKQLKKNDLDKVPAPALEP